MTTMDSRQDPDALLAVVQREEQKLRRGRLKVFFGMAAGVGKTYAMLEEARARAAEGADVIVGYAEQHIRPDTEALLLGMEILPHKQVEYRHSFLREFDLDAALTRKPTIVLVDELAHTNAPGMRHPKRWQDVIELLDAGISVYTTLNVQHLESVNDIVERVTGVRVQETLPDRVLEEADEVELVDIAPEELLERFREGKVYRPEQAERAAKHFFTKGNLIALRELALRTTAQRVDVQMQEARREAGVRTTWATNERVLVCIGPSPMSRRLVRSAKRLATGLKGQWIAAYVQTPAMNRLSPRDRLRVEGTLRLAEELGGTTVSLSGERIADAVIDYARTHNVTKIVAGKPVQSPWRDRIFGSVVDDLIRHSGEIDVYIIRGEVADESPDGDLESKPRHQHDWRGYIASAIAVAAATLLGWPLHHHLGLSNINVLMLYLLGVLWISTHYSRSAAVLASLLGVAAFDFCFVPPYLKLSVSDREYIVTFAIMLLTALVISTLTLRVRAQAEFARHRERRTAALLSLSKELASVRTAEEIAGSTVSRVSEVLSGRAMLLVPDREKRLIVKADTSDAMSSLGEKEASVAQWVFDHGRPAGLGTDTLPAAAALYMPLQTPRGTAGVLGIFASNGRVDWTPEQRQLIAALASQAAVAMERATLAEESRQAWERVEAEFLRNTLLSGVSHELRTPLAAITGAVTTLKEAGNALAADAESEMLETIYNESERMDRLIENLLDMTRLESGGLLLKKEWQPVEEVIGAALRHLDRRLGGRPVSVVVPTDIPLVDIDTVAMEQVLTNLLDNAVEYTPAGSAIDVSARRVEGGVAIDIADHGPGFPAGTERRVFEKFFRAGSGSRRGIGLGLAICRGIIEAHGGTIAAANQPGGGAVVSMMLPVTTQPKLIQDDPA